LWQVLLLLLLLIICYLNYHILFFLYGNREKENIGFNPSALQPTAKHSKAGKAFERKPCKVWIG
jgi:hypothetical protein